MTLLAKQWVRCGVIYFLKASAFAVGSYLLISTIYGGIRITFIAWCVVVFLAFAVAYVPYLVRWVRSRTKGDGTNKGNGGS